MDLFAELGKHLGVSNAGARRLCGSIWSSFASEQEPGGWELGFRLDSRLQQDMREDKLLFNTVEKKLREYQSRCPTVTRWLCRGDFQAHKPVKAR